MAHPYKQKYNNFNGPGHDSPAENKLIYKLLEGAYKWGKKALTRTPKQPKFTPIDAPKGWKKIQEAVGKRYVDDAGKLKKGQLAKDAAWSYIIGQATTGEEERRLHDTNEVKKDNIIFQNDNRSVKEAIEWHKRGDLEKSE